MSIQTVLPALSGDDDVERVDGLESLLMACAVGIQSPPRF